MPVTLPLDPIQRCEDAALEGAVRVISRGLIPVAAFIAGRTAPKGKRWGHAGAIIGGADDTAQAKIDALCACGIAVAESPADIGLTMAEALGLQPAGV